VKPALRKKVAGYFRERYRVSTRRAAENARLARATMYYRKQSDPIVENLRIYASAMQPSNGHITAGGAFWYWCDATVSASASTGCAASTAKKACRCGRKRLSAGATRSCVSRAPMQFSAQPDRKMREIGRDVERLDDRAGLKVQHRYCAGLAEVRKWARWMDHNLSRWKTYTNKLADLFGREIDEGDLRRRRERHEETRRWQRVRCRVHRGRSR